MFTDEERLFFEREQALHEEALHALEFSDSRPEFTHQGCLADATQRAAPDWATEPAGDEEDAVPGKISRSSQSALCTGTRCR